MEKMLGSFYLEGEKRCRDCQDRYVGCHADCEDYIRVRKRWEDYKENLKKLKANDKNYRKFKAINIEKTIRETKHR